MESFSFLSNAHPAYIEQLYRQYQTEPESVDLEWHKFFAGFDYAFRFASDASRVSPEEINVALYIEAYRQRAHLIANTNPLKKRKDRHPYLDLSQFGLSGDKLDNMYEAGRMLADGPLSLRDILAKLNHYYNNLIGYEFAMVREPEELQFLRSMVESDNHDNEISHTERETILRELNEAVVFEQFLGKKYIGEKRFSLEGGESTIPAIHKIIRTVAAEGAEELVMGMAHRGRLNVLSNILGKTYEEIFSEFEGNEPSEMTMGSGDVKYHLGYASQYETSSGSSVYLKLTPNPSHLEAVDPIMLGYVRAQSDAIYNGNLKKIVPLMIHGDAAVAGQGVVYEVVQMAKLKGYQTGGTIHLVINNQIGFTTDFDDARSSDYCTALAYAINAPVLHVNGDDVEAVVFAAKLCARYRQKFQKDIFLDLVCYRKHGHNESDDPKFTQPSLYKLIQAHKNPRDLYIDKLTSLGDETAGLAKKLDEEFWQELQARLDSVKQKPWPYKPQELKLEWQKFIHPTIEHFQKSPDTFIDKKVAKQIIEKLSFVPEGFHPLKKVDNYLKERRALMNENGTIDWAAGELLAYSSLLLEGKLVRLSGEDVKRGTFSHRHACIFDEDNNAEHNRLSQLSEKQGKIEMYNSHLSEYGVLGFEYGYSISNPNALVIWEAQFGDFANTAQVIIDQFIASGESKWNRSSGLVLLLPHGYEGQGPEHSSARLERYLQLCSDLNMIVVNISSPANFFHAIRRQLTWNFRKPMIVMSPKSLLRGHFDKIDQIFTGGFQEFLDDENANPKQVKRVLLCSGRLYVDLLARQKEENRNDIAIVRMEQLYPFAQTPFENLQKKYTDAEWFWVQEEPANMGARTYIKETIEPFTKIRCISRKASASTATGFKKQHIRELKEILDQAFEPTQKG